MTHTHVEPLKVRYHDPGLDVDVIAVKGYRGRCKCEWRGPVRSHHSHARDDARRHRREEHEPENAAPKREDESASGAAASS